MVIIETIFIWVVVGVWICFKRNWYADSADYSSDSTPNFICGCTIILAPFALLIAFFDVFIKNSWIKKG